MEIKLLCLPYVEDDTARHNGADDPARHNGADDTARHFGSVRLLRAGVLSGILEQAASWDRRHLGPGSILGQATSWDRQHLGTGSISGQAAYLSRCFGAGF